MKSNKKTIELRVTENEAELILWCFLRGRMQLRELREEAIQEEMGDDLINLHQSDLESINSLNEYVSKKLFELKGTSGDKP